MEKAVGIGGVFMRARDPQVLARWYREQGWMINVRVRDLDADAGAAARR